MVKLRKISGLVFAGLLMTSAVAPLANASSVSDIFAQYPDGGRDFENALRTAWRNDSVGTAEAIADAWESASDGQQRGTGWAIGDGCTGNPANDQAVRNALSGLSGISLRECTYDRPSPFRPTSTGTNDGGGFGGGSISPNTQQNNTNDNGPQ